MENLCSRLISVWWSTQNETEKVVTMLQVNLGHFIKNMPQQRDWKTVLATGTSWVTVVWMFWYYSSNCKNYACSAFQHRENISTCAYETVFLSRCCIVAEVYLKTSVKRKSVWPEAKKKRKNPALPSSSYKSSPKKI